MLLSPPLVLNYQISSWFCLCFDIYIVNTKQGTSHFTIYVNIRKFTYIWSSAGLDTFRYFCKYFFEINFCCGSAQLTQACFLCTFWRPSRPNRASCPWVFFKSLSFFCQNLKGFWYNSLSFWQSFLIFSWKTVSK